MKKITLPWNELYGFIGRCTSRGITRMCLSYRFNTAGYLDKTRPITIVDHLVNTNMGVQKEGLEITFEGNPNKMTYEEEIVYLPK